MIWDDTDLDESEFCPCGVTLMGDPDEDDGLCGRSPMGADQASSQETRAAMRDASFYATHQHTTARGGDPYVPRYHVVAENGEGPACDPEGTLLVVRGLHGDTDETIPAGDAPPSMRCRRPACAKRWPTS